MEREGRASRKGRKKIKGDDLYRLESIRLIRRRLNVKQTSSRVLLDLKIILQLMRRTIMFLWIYTEARSCTATRVHVTTNRADDDTRLFVVYSPSPKNIHARHQLQSMLILAASLSERLRTHTRNGQKKCFCGCGGGGGEDGGGLSC